MEKKQKNTDDGGVPKERVHLPEHNLGIYFLVGFSVFGRNRRRDSHLRSTLAWPSPTLYCKSWVRAREEMIGSDGRGKGLDKKPAGDGRRCGSARLFYRRRYHKMAFRRSGVVVAACCCVALVFFGDGAIAAAAAAAGGGRGEDAGAVRHSRAGNVAGLEEGRISLSKVSKMLTSSVHMEVRAAYTFYSATCFYLRNEHPFLSPFSSGWWLHHDHRLCVSTRKDIGPFLAQR